MAKKVKLPKRTGDMTNPKAVRQRPLTKFLNSSAGRLLIAETLLIAAGAVAKKSPGARGTTARLARHASGRLVGSKGGAALGAAVLSFALRQGVRAFKHALRNGSSRASRKRVVSPVE